MSDGGNAHKGHRQRLRERAASEGLDAFNPHQVLERLLFDVIPVQDVSELAHALVNRFGSVYGVLTASMEELQEVHGVGLRTAEWLRCVGELMEAYRELRPDDRPGISNYQAVFRFCMQQKKRVKPPAAYQLCLAPTGRILLCSRMCDSTAWAEPEVLRRSMEEMLAAHASNVIIIVFVGSETPVPSDYDRERAQKYAFTLSMMRIILQDVVFVGENEITSMRRENEFGYDEIYKGQKTNYSAGYLKEEDEAVRPPDDAFPENDNGL